MLWDTHLHGGILAGGIAAAYVYHGQPFGVEACVVVGLSAASALLVDIDHQRSTVSKATLATRAVSSGLAALTYHRGIVHTPFFIALLCAFVMYMSPWAETGTRAIILGLGSGWLSHLILDSLNPQGIMWLYPFTKERIHIAKIYTGSKQENTIRSVLIIASVIFGVYIISQIGMVQDFADKIVPEIEIIAHRAKENMITILQSFGGKSIDLAS